MREWDLLPELRTWLGTEEKDELLLSALRQAIAVLSGLTGLSPLPEELAPAAVELAARVWATVSVPMTSLPFTV